MPERDDGAMDTGTGSPIRAAGTLRLGIDIGSTTVKAVLRDDLPILGDTDIDATAAGTPSGRTGTVLFQDYRRHNADSRAELRKLLADIESQYPGCVVSAAITGSGGLSLANALRVPFVQEVIAGTEATRQLHPEVDVIIELGGEDAKLTYLHPTPEQRMNGTCAGGTGAFIDQMASLLKTDAGGLNELASHYTQLYPIASRCGVFAKSDLQPLINQGAAHEDLAASVFTAVATQTIAGLANGRPIRGTVMFLGGPLHFLPELRHAYERMLNGVDAFVSPDDAQLYVALGASFMADGAPTPLTKIISRLDAAKVDADSARMRPLFANQQERDEFMQRHAAEAVPRIDTSEARGRCWLGIDAGSTTIKAIVIDGSGQIVFSHYASNEGDPVAGAVEIVKRVREALPEGTVIGRACSTGYGEGLVKTALRMDEGEVETMAHFRAAETLQPRVTSVIDIGGQDMKYLTIKDRTVDSISVNEACSSGCGSFLQTFAASLGSDVRSFATAALSSEAPVDLGTRCTVFMNSSVKQAQKEGADLAAISAGLSYSVVRNALYKVIKLKSPSDLGEHVVVQGGTFLNDAVLRAFELLTGREVVRPDIAGLMGAYGAALTARMHDDGNGQSSLVQLDDLSEFSVETTRKTCRLCQNHCQMTISTFSNGERHVSGNRCDRGASLERLPKKSELPNLYDWKYKRVFGYRRLTEAKATRGDIGIPRVLNMYENYPFWFTLLTQLGFRVMLSGRSSHELFERGIETIPSENVCYPAKLVHGHIDDLLERGLTTIFYPCVSYEQELTQGADNHYNCPVVATYPEVIRNNMQRLMQPGVTFLSPFVNLSKPEHLVGRLVDVFREWNISKDEMGSAVDKAYEEDAAVKAEVRAKGEESLAWMRANGVEGIVLAGRPYHLDPEINHGIPEVINGLGMAVLTEDSVCDGRLDRPLRVQDQWSYHSRLYEAAARVGDEPDLELVQLNSFGCGVDAITTDQVQEILEEHSDVYTTLKIDEVSNLGAARIRLRSLAAAIGERRRAAEAAVPRTNTLGPLRSTGPARSVKSAGSTGPARATRPTRSSGPTREGRPRTGQSSPNKASASRPTATQTPQATGFKPGNSATSGAVRRTHPASQQPRAVFTEAMREQGYQILAPQMAPIQFRLIVPVLQRSGYNVRLLEHATAESNETGLKYVNNDSCYPSIVVIGQLLEEFTSGRADPDHAAVAITQTGGMCRATNYASLLRRGLKDAGYPQVPVIAVSAQGIEQNPGFRLTLTDIHRAAQAIVYGDMLQKMLLRVHPYEAEEGSSMALYRRWDEIGQAFFGTGKAPALGPHATFRRIIDQSVAEFDALPLRDIPRKPRVGLVGEILVKFHPDANNHAVQVIEEEGCEAVLPGLLQFFEYTMASAKWNHDNLGIGGLMRWSKPVVLWAMQRYEQPAHAALARTNGKFDVGRPIKQMAARSTGIASMGNQAGEGWYLTAEMVDMIEHGCPNIICAQPFACLPNHVVGKGMFRALRDRYPQANVAAVDYDPGASAVNQLNRIRLLLSTAVMQNGRGEFADGLDEVGGELGSGAERDRQLVGAGCALTDLIGAAPDALGAMETSGGGSGISHGGMGAPDPAGRRQLPLSVSSVVRDD